MTEKNKNMKLALDTPKPHDKDAEQIIIGMIARNLRNIMIPQKHHPCATLISKGLSKDDFYNPTLASIFEAIKEMFQKGEPFGWRDIVKKCTRGEKCVCKKTLDECILSAFREMKKHEDERPKMMRDANIILDAYFRVRKYAKLRMMLGVFSEAIQRCYSSDIESSDVIAFVNTELMKIEQGNKDNGTES